MARVFMPDIVSNEAPKTYLCETILHGSVSHAYIIEGPKGFGKHLFAEQTAMALLCHNQTKENLPLPCMNCPSCHKILTHMHPDVTTVSRGNESSFGVDIIRSIKADITRPPVDRERRVIIIEDADTMTVQAQNAFLLTLEEPPAYLVFLLLCTRADTLLATITSRAPVIRMTPVGTEAMADYLQRKAVGLDGDTLAEIIMASGGSIGYAMALSEGKSTDSLHQTRDNVSELVYVLLEPKLTSQNWPLIAGLIRKKRMELDSFLTMVENALRDLIALRTAPNPPLIFFTNKELAITWAYKATSTKLNALWELVEDTRKSIVLQNGNIKLVLTSFACSSKLIRSF